METTTLQLILVAIAALSGMIAAVFAHLDRKKTSKVEQAVQGVHLDLNSRLSELVEAVRRAAYAEGLAKGRTESKAEGKAEGKP